MNFPDLWRAYAPDLPEPVAEYRFAPPRRWRFDFAWPCHVRDEGGVIAISEDVALGGVAVEFDGGQWCGANGGRHNRDSDRDKLNHASAMGWKVLRFSNQQWEASPAACIDLIRRALTTP